MPESTLVSNLITLVVLGWFMIACPVLCICFSIFSDTINIGGIFEKIGDTVVNVVFIPIILLGKILDAVTSIFIEPDMKYAIDHANSLRGRD